MFTTGHLIKGKMLEGKDDIQGHLDRPEEWAHVKLMKFNKVKCKVLHLDWGNHQYQYRLGDERIESSQWGMTWGYLVDEKLDVNQQCALIAQKTHHMLG